MRCLCNRQVIEDRDSTFGMYLSRVTLSVIIKTKDVINKMVQGVATYQHKPDFFQNITYKYFTSAATVYRQEFNIEILWKTGDKQTLLQSRNSELDIPDTKLPISTPTYYNNNHCNITD